MKNVIVRSISGAVYIALIVGAIILGRFWVAGLFSIFGLVGIMEMRRMTSHAASTPLDFASYLSQALGLLGIIWFNVTNDKSLTFLCLGLITLSLCFRMILAIYDHEGRALNSFLADVASTVYLGLPMAALIALYNYSEYLVLAMFILIWINDTGAFCVGSLIGKHKMFPRLSPKKSWEGLAGGLIFCLVFGGLTSLISSWNITPGLGIALGATVCVGATYGDLFESLIKRCCGVKDSGHIIPGHGGILDRIDSLLLVAPLIFILTLIYGGIG